MSCGKQIHIHETYTCNLMNAVELMGGPQMGGPNLVTKIQPTNTELLVGDEASDLMAHFTMGTGGHYITMLPAD